MADFTKMFLSGNLFAGFKPAASFLGRFAGNSYRIDRKAVPATHVDEADAPRLFASASSHPPEGGCASTSLGVGGLREAPNPIPLSFAFPARPR
jgi:hypothetical protein